MSTITDQFRPAPLRAQRPESERRESDRSIDLHVGRADHGAGIGPTRPDSEPRPTSARARPDDEIGALFARFDRMGQDAPVTIRVFLVDDHEIVRRGLRELLNAEDGIEVIGEAGTAEEALHRVLALEPDLAVLDVRLGEGNGVELCREIRSRRPETACLMLTSFADDDALFNAIMAGAAGYVLKQVRGSDLVDSIRRVAAGQSLLDPALTARVLERIRKGPEEDERLAGLTPQERRILELLAEGLTNRQIGEHLFLAEKTVKNYVSNLLLKMGMHRRTEAAAYAARLSERQNRRT